MGSQTWGASRDGASSWAISGLRIPHGLHRDCGCAASGGGGWWFSRHVRGLDRGLPGTLSYRHCAPPLPKEMKTLDQVFAHSHSACDMCSRRACFCGGLRTDKTLDIMRSRGVPFITISSSLKIFQFSISHHDVSQWLVIPPLPRLRPHPLPQHRLLERHQPIQKPHLSSPTLLAFLLVFLTQPYHHQQNRPNHVRPRRQRPRHHRSRSRQAPAPLQPPSPKASSSASVTPSRTLYMPSPNAQSISVPRCRPRKPRLRALMIFSPSSAGRYVLGSGRGYSLP